MDETAETLADKISSCADVIENRLSNDIVEGNITGEQANSIMDQIQVLREQANALYMQNIIDAVATQAEAQQKLKGLINEAKQKIETVHDVATAIDLAADIIELAARAHAGDAGGVLESIGKLRDDVGAIQVG